MSARCVRNGSRAIWWRACDGALCAGWDVRAVLWRRARNSGAYGAYLQLCMSGGWRMMICER